MFKFETTIYWSNDDSCYIAEASELPGYMAHGNSYETALLNLKDVIQLWIDTANECGDPIPEPKIHGLPHA